MYFWVYPCYIQLSYELAIHVYKEPLNNIRTTTFIIRKTHDLQLKIRRCCICQQINWINFLMLTPYVAFSDHRNCCKSLKTWPSSIVQYIRGWTPNSAEVLLCYNSSLGIDWLCVLTKSLANEEGDEKKTLDSGNISQVGIGAKASVWDVIRLGMEINLWCVLRPWFHSLLNYLAEIQGQDDK